MAYTAPITWTDGDVPTAAQLNQQIRDNLNYLHSGRTIFQHLRSVGTGNLTTTSTSNVIVTGFDVYFETDISRIFYIISFNMGVTGGTGVLELYLNGSNVGVFWVSTTPNSASVMNQCLFLREHLSLANNVVHHFELFWRVTSGTATMYCDQSIINFVGVEF